MKNLTNVKFQIGDMKQSYAELVKACASNIGKEGVSIAEQRKRIRILDVVEKNEEVMNFEDADADVLKSLVSSMPWALVNKDIVAFGDAVEKM
jgi:hypothetical protein